ncbi:hypothetical protein E0K89_013465, partial [Aquicoccus sp. SCR17]|nr:hypothetical protein [Carideicomes alvinocaridis]
LAGAPAEGPILDEAAAKRRGTLLHLLLEHLPGTDPERWPALAQHLLAGRPGPATEEPEERPSPAEAEIAELLAEATAVLTAPALAPLFTGEALAEVPFSAPITGERRLHGTIDRLVVTPDTVRIIDFKSNALVPATPGEVPQGILAQMGAYATAMAQIYPGRRIETAVLWTRTAELMDLPQDLVIGAWETTTTP